MNDRNRNDILNLRRSQLTKAAYQVVSKKGYYNFTIKDIANEAGLSTGLVHYYFKDKQDLLLTLLKEINSNVRHLLDMEIRESSDPRDKLDIFITQAFNIVEREQSYFYVLLDFWTQLNHNERMRNAIRKLYESYRSVCSGILSEGVEAGYFKGDMDIHYTATMIVSMIQGTIIQYVIDPGSFNYGDFTTKIKNQVIQEIIIKVSKGGV
ncbi:MAG TPA: TetR/AcrR family transcriptional regulator [Spirochaetota bacterium]|nr:TetR/AcrR family transcriptional regulator [Spirochaetota bacterium]